MAETGVPSSIAKGYADPSQGYQFAGSVIPNMTALDQGQQKIDIDRQRAETDSAQAATGRFNAETSRQNAATAKLQQEMQGRESEARIAKFKQDMALDAALFETRKRTAVEQLHSLTNANAKADKDLEDRMANDTLYADFSRWRSNLDPERAMLDPKVQDEFFSFMSRARGIDMKRQLHGEFEGAKKNAFEMSQTALASKWSPAIGGKLLEGWGMLSPAQKKYRIDVGNNRQAETDRVAAAKSFNESIRAFAPELTIDVDQFKTGTDEFGNDTYDVHGLEAEASVKKAQFEAERTLVSAARAQSDRAILGKEKANGDEVVVLTKQLANVQDNLRALANARESKSEDAMAQFVASILATRNVDPKTVAAVNGTGTDAAAKEARDKARTELMTTAMTDWKKQEQELLAQVREKQKAQPRAEFYQLTKDVSATARDLRVIQEAQKKGEAWATEAQVKQVEALLQAKKDALNSFIGEDHSHFYDGTYKVSPRGVTGAAE